MPYIGILAAPLAAEAQTATTGGQEAVPSLRHIAIVWTPIDPGSALGFKRAQEKYSSLGVKVTSAPVRSSEDFVTAFEILSRERPDFLDVHPTPVISANRQRLAEFALHMH